MIHPRGWMTRAGTVLLAVLLLTLLVCVGCGSSAEQVAETTVANGSNEVVTTGTSQRTTTTAKTNPWTEVKSSTSTIPATQPGADSSAGASTTGSAVTTGPSNSSSGGASLTTDGAHTSTSQAGTSTTRTSTVTTARATTTTARPTTTTAPPTTTTKRTTTTTAGATVLEVTGPSGTKSYTMAQLKAKPAVSGYWGAHKDNTSIGYYTGVRLFDLLDEVGGLPAGKGLRITASDGFTCDYEAKRIAAMANGTYQMWDCNGTLVTWADDIETTGSVQMVVAYSMDGKPLPTSGEGAGPLRVVLIQDNDKMLTEGKYAPYMAKSITVR